MQAQQLNESDKTLLEKIAIDKAKTLSLYIKKLTNDSLTFKDKEDVREQALLLFISDDVTIQVSYCPQNGKPIIKTITIDDYLRNLMALDYDTVIIEWVAVDMVNKIKKGADGNYHGTVSARQKFTGIKGEFVYSDETVKDYSVIIKFYKKPNEIAEEDWHYDMFLSDVKVKEPC